MSFRSSGFFILFITAVLRLPAAEGPAHVPGRVLAGLKDSVDAGLLTRTLQLHRAGMHKLIPQPGVAILDVPEPYGDAVIASLRATGLFRYVERDYYAHTAAAPNDPKYPSQWHLPKIQAPQAWAITTGAASVLVAVIDSGVDAQHPDLKPHLVSGWNLRTGTADTDDQVGHGTAVIGTIAAASDNGIGVASVNWAARILPLAVVDATDNAAYSDVAAAIVYAADHGARVLNISIGGVNTSSTLQTAVDYAWGKGALIFASAMNDAASTRNYPAACNHVVAVSATDAADHLAFFSNYGDWITLAAPGTSVLTTAIGSGYGYWNGTSFASPLAAGVAALVLAVNPALSNEEVLELMKATAEDLGDPGKDKLYGWGRINAYRAVMAAYRRENPLPDRPPQTRHGR